MYICIPKSRRIYNAHSPRMEITLTLLNVTESKICLMRMVIFIPEHIHVFRKPYHKYIYIYIYIYIYVAV